VRKFLGEIGGSIELQDTFVDPLQRENDQFLMDMAIRSRKFTPGQLKKINYCRMYLNVLLLSDVVKANGKELDEGLYAGTLRPNMTKHRVNQAKPSSKSWKQWRRLLRMAASKHYSLTLDVPLGKWFLPVEQLRKQWPFVYDPDSDTLFAQCPYGFSQHSRLGGGFDMMPMPTPTHATIPSTAVPIDITIGQHSFSYMQYWSTFWTEM
jgi:hypothetical protein